MTSKATVKKPKEITHRDNKWKSEATILPNLGRQTITERLRLRFSKKNKERLYKGFLTDFMWNIGWGVRSDSRGLFGGVSDQTQLLVGLRIAHGAKIKNLRVGKSNF